MLKEFDCELVGIGVLVDHTGAETKLVENYYSIIDLKNVDKNGVVDLQPSTNKNI